MSLGKLGVIIRAPFPSRYAPQRNSFVNNALAGNYGNLTIEKIKLSMWIIIWLAALKLADLFPPLSPKTERLHSHSYTSSPARM